MYIFEIMMKRKIHVVNLGTLPASLTGSTNNIGTNEVKHILIHEDTSTVAQSNVSGTKLNVIHQSLPRPTQVGLGLLEAVKLTVITRANIIIVKPGAIIPGLANNGPAMQEEQCPLHIRSENNGAENLTDLEMVWVHHVVVCV